MTRFTKAGVVQSISLGSRVAEDEKDELRSYFVRSSTWREVREGKVDIVLAPKGGGKTAIYTMLLTDAEELESEKVLLAQAENPTGTPVFSALASDVPTEASLVPMWKLYLLVLICQRLRLQEVKSEALDTLFEYLRDADLLPHERPRASLLAMVREYVGRLLKPSGFAGTMHLDGSGAVSGFTGKIEFTEPTAAASRQGHVSIDTLFQLAEEALEHSDRRLWILFDRLDAAFAASPDVEKIAIRALFRAYGDLSSLDRIKLKIFLRTDIWETVMDDGFREASHVVREAVINWSEEALMQLVIRRFLQNPTVLDFYEVEEDAILASSDAQYEFFNRLFRPQVEAGSGKPQTWRWCLSRTQDGTGFSAPRELIHLFDEVRKIQLEQFETRQEEPPGEALFHPKTFGKALPEVSKTRLTKTIYAEFTDVRDRIEALADDKADRAVSNLSRVWAVSEAEARSIARRLVSIGLFAHRTKDDVYSVPFMYRPALRLKQGLAV